MNELFKGYSSIHHSIHFRYNPDGGNQGVKDVEAGRSQFAINTRPPESTDVHTSQSKLFLDGLCIDVNSANSLGSVSLTSLKDIFLGDDTQWSQVPGSSLGSATIAPIGRNATAGQYTFFQSAVLNGQTQSSNVAEEGSDPLVATTIEHNKDAIGYVGLANSRKSGEHSLSVNGVGCNAGNIRTAGKTNGASGYPLYRYDWAVTPNGKPNKTVDAFLDWVIESKAAGKIINEAGAVSAFNK